jgi:hypothetical protein
VSSELW